MFAAQSRSGPTAIGWRKFERTRRRLTMRNAGNGQSLQCLRKKKTNGRHASKNASQLETIIATELAKSFSSGMEEVVRQAPALRKRFFIGAGWPSGPAGCAAVLIGLLFSSRKMGAYWLRLVV